MTKYTHFIGLDVHKDRISVALAKPGRSAPTFYGQIASTPAALSQLVSRLATKPGALSFCYEAGPCGYGVYRQLQSMGYPCQVVAPSLIPRKPGDRLKTDRRDALQLARLHRSGDLTGVWVPDQEQEAIRDLVRCREDMKGIERHARQRLCGFLLRHGQVYGGKSRWTAAHFRWLAQVRLEHPAQQIVLQEYIDTVQAAQNRVSALEKEMAQTVESWSLAPVVEGLMALRGVALITAMTIVADISRINRRISPLASAQPHPRKTTREKIQIPPNHT
ncbi:MAG: IS110 family transposase [Candidatus Latescibacteria bacterium]|nr:IS110 family transposase [Candidatus Latescibacterota bacterium]